MRGPWFWISRMFIIVLEGERPLKGRSPDKLFFARKDRNSQAVDFLPVFIEGGDGEVPTVGAGAVGFFRRPIRDQHSPICILLICVTAAHHPVLLPSVVKEHVFPFWILFRFGWSCWRIDKIMLVLDCASLQQYVHDCIPGSVGFTAVAVLPPGVLLSAGVADRVLLARFADSDFLAIEQE